MAWNYCPHCGVALEDGPREGTFWCDEHGVIDPDDWTPIEVHLDENSNIVGTERNELAGETDG